LVGFGRVRGAGSGPMPHPAPVRGDVDLAWLVRVENDAVTPLEVVSLDSCPMIAAVGGAIGRGVEAADVKSVRMVGIDRQIVDMLRLRE